VLRGLYVGRRTGSLTFIHDGERRGVHFRRGNIVNADTDVREDRLGAVLVRSGRLTEADRRRAEGFAIRDRKRFGPVLVELGLLDRAGLEEALALHVDTVLSKVFAWTDGRYEVRHYEEELPLADGEATLRVSTGDLILQAARSVQDPDVVRYNLGDLDRVLFASSDPLLRFQRIRLAPLDGYVMSRVDGTLSAREVIQVIPLPARDVERSLFGLLSTGVVEFRGAGGKPKPDRAPVATTGVSPRPPATAVASARIGPESATAPAPPPDDLPASPSAAGPPVFLDRPRLAEPPSGDATVVLDGPPGDEPPPLDPTVVLDAAAFAERLGAEPTVILDSPSFEERPPVDPTVVVSNILEPLHPAELRRLEVQEMHQGLQTKNHFELLGVPHDATEPQVREAYFRLAKRYHPDGQLEADLGGMREALEVIFRRLGEAYEILRNPRIRVVYEKNLARAAMIAPAEATGPAPTGGGASETPEASLARAVDSFASEKYWEVVQILEKAVPRSQGAVKQRQRVLLARAYARTPD